jgi:hypothetical protein
MPTLRDDGVGLTEAPDGAIGISRAGGTARGPQAGFRAMEQPSA